ncbi:MAG: hypothetical protein A3F99_02040 [Candidatus Colwellbacteria bacterium RIFCSPLOWO2_12_FULL_43_11]|uniref:Uncharacterized protein n=1 Tax=Candidatus Colwellbacteria bacterium RIFCSPLOWO2_12_FULL_43_11 TaxID=1797693 RepID=A0A1G1ZA10_9BACT|nr:MAG: hypothetical protein A3F99_02040 [Candidatus Colwellbacteria bacterium RIFCSPLOWO2_12_FULL_43_11]
MAYIPIYLTIKFFNRLQEFLKHWYVGGFRIGSHLTISVLERLDRRLAFRVTLKYFFQPLFQDRSVIGYIFGFLFRSGRLIIALALYLLVVIFALSLYAIWAATLPFLVYQTAAAYNLVPPLIWR